ncbi:MAG: ArsR/SmtB family transcription factor [Bacillota bacterium]
MDDIFKRIKAVADRNRLKLIKLLLTNNYCVQALAKKLNISESAVSQQLKILREVDLVIGEKEGYFVHYTVKTDNLKEIADYLYKLSDMQNEKNDSNCCQPNKDRR